MAASAVRNGHVGLNVRDLERSIRFYRDVLGLKLIQESSHKGSRFAFMGWDDDISLTLWEQAEAVFDRSRSGLHHLSFQAPSIEAVEAAERRIRELQSRVLWDGVVPHQENADSGGVYFEDPDGIRLEIFAPAGAQANKKASTDGPACGFF